MYKILKIVVDDSRDSGHFDTVPLAGPDRVVGFYKKWAFSLRESSLLRWFLSAFQTKSLRGRGFR